jgi:uncharacterized membrane protein YphA (DoxX/SURF4 family)
MGTLTQSAGDLAFLEPQTEQQSIQRWPLVLRVVLRFCLVYFGLFCLTTQVLGGLINIPKVDIPDLAALPPLRQLIFWVAADLFRAPRPLVYNGSGSGDKTFDWVMCFCFLIIAALATAIWSILDRKRASYIGMYKWFRLFLRFALGSQMLTYGFVKVFPMQMPFPGLVRLLEPFGNFSPMGVLWYSIGASPAYERLCGSAELLAGILLLIPGLTLLGALVTAAVTSEIFILNMTYDVPVKILSVHLLLIAFFLASPELSRLTDFFLRNRAVAASSQPNLFRTQRANRIATAAQLVFALWLVGSNIYGSWTQWPVWGGGQPLSPLYGIWKVDTHSIDGHERSPLIGDYGRWRRIVFDSPDYVAYQRMDDSFGNFNCAIDQKNQTIALTKADDKKWKGLLHYQRPKPGQLILDGDVGGHPMHMQLALFDRSKFQLVGRGFHWVQEYPYNR